MKDGSQISCISYCFKLNMLIQYNKVDVGFVIFEACRRKKLITRCLFNCCTGLQVYLHSHSILGR